MKMITVSIGLALALVLPAGAIAKPHPDNADKRAAKAECKTLRGNTDATREAFGTQFRSFAACVRKTAVEEAQEEKAAHTNAAKECKADGLRGRAFGECVSTKAKAKEHAADEQDAEDAAEFKNAAKECDAERTANAADFAEHYGTNENNRNAFGKCVSSKASDGVGETQAA
jgi:hypothetical protein